MSPKRDLSAFSAPAGLPAPPKASGPRKVTPATTGKASGTSTKPRKSTTKTAPTARPKAVPRIGKKRVCVSLTAETHDALRELSDLRDVWKVDVILEGLDHWAAKLAAEKATAPRGRRRRSRRGSNPTPFVMDLTYDELERLDALAARCASSRSAMVRQLIELEANRNTEPPS